LLVSSSYSRVDNRDHFSKLMSRVDHNNMVLPSIEWYRVNDPGKINTERITVTGIP
jgi:hypothetical protein